MQSENEHHLAPSLHRVWKYIFSHQKKSIIAVAGLLVTPTIYFFWSEMLAGDPVTWLSIIQILFIAFAVLLVSSNATYVRDNLDKSVKSIQSELEKSLRLKIEWLPDNKGDPRGLERSRAIARNASNEILVVSQYVPATFKKESKETRKRYLSEGISEVIKNKFEQNDKEEQKFLYKRVIQVDDDSFEDLEKAEIKVLKRDYLKNDPETFEHCLELYRFRENNQLQDNIVFYVTRPIPSFPSTLIIDKRHVHFALSARREKTDNNLWGFGVVSIEGTDGEKCPKAFADLFNVRLQRISTTIAEIEDSHPPLSPPVLG